ncbi:MAG: hypothetical protein FWD69_17875 [Polyangiaceae bacterium]|nr:hypothetical protein [Polyangiaceae bacterium]
MPRSYDVTDLVTLPMIDAASTVALLTRIAAVAREAGEKTFPPIIKKRLATLADVNKALIDALAKRDSGRTSPSQQRDVDTVVDTGWSATYKWLTGWSRLGDKAGHHLLAKNLLDILFPDGLKFTLTKYEKEWAEVKWRLARISADNLDKHFAKLGGQSFLDRLIKDHKVYGDVLKITEVGQMADPVLIREPLLAAHSALRSFVLVAAAHVDENPDDQALVERLLRPIVEWQGSQVRPSAGATSPAPTPPAIAADVSPQPPEPTCPTCPTDE